MEEASNTIIGEVDQVDIRDMNKKLEEGEPTLELMEAALNSMRQELREIGSGLDETLREADAAVSVAEGERRNEGKIDEFAQEVARRQGK